MSKLSSFLIAVSLYSVAAIFLASSAFGAVSIVPVMETTWTENNDYPAQQYTMYALNVSNSGPNAVCYVKFNLCLFCPVYNFVSAPMCANHPKSGEHLQNHQL